MSKSFFYDKIKIKEKNSAEDIMVPDAMPNFCHSFPFCMHSNVLNIKNIPIPSNEPNITNEKSSVEKELSIIILLTDLLGQLFKIFTQ